jgi:hypothetical protein
VIPPERDLQGRAVLRLRAKWPEGATLGPLLAEVAPSSGGGRTAPFDADGVATFDDLPTGWLHYEVGGSGCCAGGVVRLTDGSVAEQEVELRPGFLLDVTVRSAINGAPLPEATVRWDDQSVPGSTDGDGRYVRWTPVPGEGELLVAASAPGHAWTGTRLRTPGAGGRAEVRLLLPWGGSLLGTVRADGRAVPQGVVVLEWEGAAPWGGRSLRGEADAEGRYVFHGLPPGVPLRVHAWIGARESVASVVSVTAEEPDLELDLELRPDPTVRVRVIDPKGSPLRGAHVLRRFTRAAAGTTDGDGLLRIEGLERGEQDFRISAAGHVSTWKTIDLRETDDVEVDVVLEEAAVVSGSLRSADGRALTAAKVRLHREDGSWETQTDAEGRFTLVDAPAGLLRLRVVHDGRLVPVAPEEVHAPVEGLQLVASPTRRECRGTVRVVPTVVARGRDEVSPSLLAVEVHDGDCTRRYAVDLPENGVWRFAAPCGRLAATFHPHGFVPVRAVLDVGEGTTTEVAIELRPGTTLRGRVVDPAGRPVPGASVKRRHDHEPLSTVTDGEGRFTLRHGAPGPLVLHLEAEGFAPHATSPLPAAPTDEVRLTFPRGGVLEGTLLDSRGLAVGGAEVQLEARDGEAAGQAPEPVRTDWEGRFSIRAAAGHYRLRAPGRALAEPDGLELLEGETTRAGFRVAP